MAIKRILGSSNPAVCDLNHKYLKNRARRIVDVYYKGLTPFKRILHEEGVSG
jgi:hypothetical protein